MEGKNRIESTRKLLEMEIELHERNYKEALIQRLPYQKLRTLRENIRLLKEKLKQLNEDCGV